jgi:hypothetical protein
MSRQAPFNRKRTLAQARDLMLNELRLLLRLRVLPESEVVISTNVLGLDRREPEDKGVAVYFTLKGRAQVLACDRWDRVADNLYAIGLHIKSLRAQLRYGVGSLEQALGGYLALPAKEPWWKVLGVRESAGVAEIDAAYYRLAPAAHPDHGGSDEAMARLNTARDEGRTAARLR